MEQVGFSFLDQKDSPDFKFIQDHNQQFVSPNYRNLTLSSALKENDAKAIYLIRSCLYHQAKKLSQPQAKQNFLKILFQEVKLKRLKAKASVFARDALLTVCCHK